MVQNVMIAESIPRLAVRAIMKRGPRVPPIRNAFHPPLQLTIAAVAKL